MGCGCFGEEKPGDSPIKASTSSVVSAQKSAAIDPEALLKLGSVLCNVRLPSAGLVSEYQTFLVIADKDLHQRTDLQRAIVINPGRDPICPVDIRTADKKKVISLCVLAASELKDNLHLAFDALASGSEGNVLVVFEQNSLGEDNLFAGENVTFFAEEFVQFCLILREQLRVDIATDCPGLPLVLRKEACRRFLTI